MSAGHRNTLVVSTQCSVYRVLQTKYFINLPKYFLNYVKQVPRILNIFHSSPGGKLLKLVGIKCEWLLLIYIYDDWWIIWLIKYIYLNIPDLCDTSFGIVIVIPIRHQYSYDWKYEHPDFGRGDWMSVFCRIVGSVRWREENIPLWCRYVRLSPG